MAANVTIAIDAMSGDEGPDIVVPAALGFLKKNKASRLVLVGDQPRLEALMRNKTVAGLTIVHAESVVEMHDRPSFALRNKLDSSMAIALKLVAEGQADGCVSAGNTGALMMMGRAILRTYPGIDRPAITKLFPSQGGGCFILDLGANVDCSAEHLLQFAMMGQVLAEVIKKKPEPSVALLNVGGESIKGNEQVRLAASLIRDVPQINYIGFAEGGDIFRDYADVIVCDGFVGNVALKSAEGAARIILDAVRGFFSDTWYGKLLGMILKPLMGKGLRQLDPETHNGAIFLGLQGVVVKSHGNASTSSFENAIELAMAEAEADLPARINNRLDELML